MNYTDLNTAIQQYTQNDEATFVAQIPKFVRKAEQAIYDELQLLVARKNATSTTVSGTPYVQAPTDFLAPYSMAIVRAGTYYPLLVADETFIREVYPTPATTGRPEYYSMFDHNTFLLGPTPNNSTDTVELHYFYYPESIVTSTTSWLGDNAENALLYGCLMEAYRFMKAEQDVFAMTKAAYDTALDRLRMMSAGRDRGDAYRYGQFKVAVQA